MRNSIIVREADTTIAVVSCLHKLYKSRSSDNNNNNNSQEGIKTALLFFQTHLVHISPWRLFGCRAGMERKGSILGIWKIKAQKLNYTDWCFWST